MTLGDAARAAAKWLIRHVDPLLARRAEEGRPSAAVEWLLPEHDILDSKGAAVLEGAQRVIVPIVVQRVDLAVLNVLGRSLGRSRHARQGPAALAFHLRYVAFSCPWLGENPTDGARVFATLGELVRTHLVGQASSPAVGVWDDPLCLGVVRADERLWALSQRLDRPTHALGAAEGLDPRAAEAVQLAFDEASALTEAVLRWLGAD
ncbi:MAG: hypothetical protein H6704_12620 [Myxococcales bacterium]|nr:hypothetical protein [Myxococcales bacterium]